MLDLEGLLQPVDGVTPSGPDLRYAPEYGALERAVVGKPERQLGTSVVAAEPPEWRVALEKGQALLRASKDLRIAIIVTRACLELEGFPGLADGLALVGQLVTRHWDTFHPQLDAEDGNDPTARISAMNELTRREVIQAIRGAPLLPGNAAGAISLKVIEAASSGTARPGTLPAPPAAGALPVPTSASIDAAFEQASAEELAGMAASLGACVNASRELAETWSARLPAAGPDFTELRALLVRAHQLVKGRLDQRQKPGAPGGALDTTANGGTAMPAPQRAGVGVVESREDVLRALDAICNYYVRHEPTSPVPLLLQRGKRLVTMSFMDILHDLLPDSIQTMQKITGKTDP
jgi:type VI secretion system protein ImpA